MHGWNICRLWKQKQLRWNVISALIAIVMFSHDNVSCPEFMSWAVLVWPVITALYRYHKVWVQVLHYKLVRLVIRQFDKRNAQSKCSHRIWIITSRSQPPLSKGVIICFIKVANRGCKRKMIHIGLFEKSGKR